MVDKIGDNVDLRVEVILIFVMIVVDWDVLVLEDVKFIIGECFLIE